MNKRYGRWPAALAAVGLLGTLPASARLGETLDQLTVRFGPPTLMYEPAQVRPPATQQCEFLKNGIRIRVCFRAANCAKITYSSSGKVFSDEELREFLEANGGPWKEEKNPTWELVKGRRAQRMWRRRDNQAWAEQTGASLTVMTFEWLRAEKGMTEEDKKAREAGKTAHGF